ncbi:MAG: hypothetical protein WBX01_10580 [Nitrososphaeraceae archaeon]
MAKRKTRLGHETKQTIMSKIDALEDLSSTDLKSLLSMINMINTPHENLQGSKQSA